MNNNKHHITFIFVFLFLFFCLIMGTSAESKQVVLTAAVNIRKGPGTTYSRVVLGKSGSKYTLKSENIIADEPKNGDCNSGWYQIEYNNETAYICASYASVINPNEPVVLEYGRPWTTPKKAIVGGAQFISGGYINNGQFTSYLKKFNVNPNSKFKLYNHQYMANLAAPYSESYTSYKSYKENGLLELPLEFTIPIFNNMPDYTTLPGKATDKTCQAEIKDKDFEELLDKEGFPESYKCKIRILHNDYPNWIFKSLKTNLDFTVSVNSEQKVSSIQGTSYYQKTTSSVCVQTFGGTYKNGYCQTESGWYVANLDTVSYYLDPRNFLVPERILMFENLAYSDNYTEKVVTSILKGTFMDNISVLDNQSYSSIFVEAGKTANVSPVYLASLAKQEVGTKLSNTTNGAEFTYQGVTYKGLYNFFNIGAFSSESNPALAGLVYASGGSESVIVGSNPSGGSSSSSGSNSSSEVNTNETDILAKLNTAKKQDCLVDLKMGTTISALKQKLSGYNVTVKNAKDTDIIKTGQEITISANDKTYTYTIAVKGDVDGDGKTGATDYVKIKNYIMEKKNSALDIAESLAADIDNNGSIGAADYVKIKNSIMEG